jgi:FtsP/CotA-like multicopper oxidase with cupredoxin domain
MSIHHVFLRIEEIADYSPVEPSSHAAANYRRDCMRNTGHEDATIPVSEVNARRLTALIYREYLDPDYLVPKPDKLVPSDVNEPIFTHRVPGTVIYTKPGERLIVHVFNADTMPHSFHVHGLRYGIDSDGSWPLGTQAKDGRRSDEICAGETWTYRFDVTDEMVGGWPFHDHSRHIGESVARGLFGGIIVLGKGHHQHPHVELPDLVGDFLEHHGRKIDEDEEEIDPPLGTGHLTHGAGGGGMGHGGGGMGGGGGGGDGGGGHDHGGGNEGGGGHEHGGGDGGHEHGAGHGKHGFEHKGVLDFLEEWSQLDYVHPKPKEGDTLVVPLFFHVMDRRRGIPAFNSGPFSPAASPFEVVFGPEGTSTYHCEIHQQMQGKVVVALGEPPEVTVSIVDTDPMNMKFDPLEARVRPGGKVRWSPGTTLHTITEDGGGIPSICFNGRSFVGNTPTIVAHAGQRIRWYVFNLDLGMSWHNFHPHGQRWQFAQETIDIRSIGPAESFVVETVAPPVLLLPRKIEEAQEGGKRHHKGAKKYELCGDFLFHCHVEMHMMQGLAGLVRSKQTVWLTDDQAEELKVTTGLPTACDNKCQPVDLDRCERLLCGKWTLVPGSPEVCMMHACLLPNTEKVLYFGYGDTRDDLSRLFDYAVDPGAFSSPANQPYDVTQPVHDRGLANIWSAEHAYLGDAKGTLVVHGGFTPRQTFQFDPAVAALSWSRKQATAEDRFYSTTMTLPDGRLLTLFGSASKSLEVYNPAAGNWSAPIAVPAGMNHHQYYPWTYLLPGGKLFIAGPHTPTQRFNWSAGGITNLESFATTFGDRSSTGEKGTSVLLPLRPPNYEPRVLIAGGDFAPAQQTAELIDLSVPNPAWQPIANLHQGRPHQVNSVLLPDGRVLVAGGIDAVDGGPAEIFDPQNPSAGWELCAKMSIPRGYHSSAILLLDGSVLMGGDKPGAWKSGETTQHERYYPSYFAFARPTITGAPASTTYGAVISVQTPNPASIGEVLLLRPGAVTHGFNMSQRMIECSIVGVDPGAVRVQTPPNGMIAPPGPYLLFILTPGRVPSRGRWIRLS